LHSVQDAWGHSGLPAFDHYVRLWFPDSRAASDVYTSDMATSQTASILRKFREKCLGCCQ
jgi:hypothetical protein